MPGDGYLRRRQLFGDNSTTKTVVAADTGPFTLITAKTNYTVFVQNITVRITTGSAGVTWAVKDAAGKTLTGNMPCDTAPTEFDIDYGPDGYQDITAGSNIQLTLSAAGAAGVVTIHAFQKLSAVVDTSLPT